MAKVPKMFVGTSEYVFFSASDDRFTEVLLMAGFADSIPSLPDRAAFGASRLNSHPLKVVLPGSIFLLSLTEKTFLRFGVICR